MSWPKRRPRGFARRAAAPPRQHAIACLKAGGRQLNFGRIVKTFDRRTGTMASGANDWDSKADTVNDDIILLTCFTI
jgi:hypothetical protein